MKGDTGAAGQSGAVGAQGPVGAQGATGPGGAPGVGQVVLRQADGGVVGYVAGKREVWLPSVGCFLVLSLAGPAPRWQAEDAVTAIGFLTPDCTGPAYWMRSDVAAPFICGVDLAGQVYKAIQPMTAVAVVKTSTRTETGSCQQDSPPTTGVGVPVTPVTLPPGPSLPLTFGTP